MRIADESGDVLLSANGKRAIFTCLYPSPSIDFKREPLLIVPSGI